MIIKKAGNMAATPRTLTPTQTQWSERITAWEISGLSQSAFCKQHELVYGVLGIIGRLTMTYRDLAPPAIVPIPVAVWLFGSGLIGLIGIARRKKIKLYTS